MAEVAESRVVQFPGLFALPAAVLHLISSTNTDIMYTNLIKGKVLQQ